MWETVVVTVAFVAYLAWQQHQQNILRRREADIEERRLVLEEMKAENQRVLNERELAVKEAELTRRADFREKELDVYRKTLSTAHSFGMEAPDPTLGTVSPRS